GRQQVARVREVRRCRRRGPHLVFGEPEIAEELLVEPALDLDRPGRVAREEQDAVGVGGPGRRHAEGARVLDEVESVLDDVEAKRVAAQASIRETLDERMREDLAVDRFDGRPELVRVTPAAHGGSTYHMTPLHVP